MQTQGQPPGAQRSSAGDPHSDPEGSGAEHRVHTGTWGAVGSSVGATLRAGTECGIHSRTQAVTTRAQGSHSDPEHSGAQDKVHTPTWDAVVMDGGRGGHTRTQGAEQGPH